MQIHPGKLVLVRPALLARPDGSAAFPDDTVFRVLGIATDGAIADGCVREGSILVEGCLPICDMPRKLAVGPDDVIEHVPPPVRAQEPRDALTGLTATEAAHLYRQRRDANLCGGEPFPCIGWDPASATLHTPYGPVTIGQIRKYEGYLLTAVPDDVRASLLWLCDVSEKRDMIREAFRHTD